MRIHVVLDDLVFPKNSGGRAEAGDLTDALHQAGHEITVTLFQRESVSPADVARNLDLGSMAQVIKRPGFGFSSVRHPSMPYQLASRLPALLSAENKQKVADRAPELIVAHHEWAVPTGRYLGALTNAPVVLRSHNDELTYLRDQAAAEPRLTRRAYLHLERARAKTQFTRRFYRDVSLALTISPEDSSFYDSRDVPHAYLPPTFPQSFSPSARPSTASPVSTVLFAGAMDMPHAVTGLMWFTRQVWPSIRQRVPDAVFVIAGRRASPELARSFSRLEGVQFLGEVEDITSVIANAHVFVNPVFAGSGINMKMGPPAALGVPIVSTRVGVRGLGGLATSVSVSDDEDSFAAAVVRILTDNQERALVAKRQYDAISEFAPATVAQRFVELTRPVLEQRYRP